MNRSSGVLMPIFSLPSKYGIGTLGKSSYDFVDFLSDAKQSYWQTLPIMQTGYGNSPYSAISSYAGNPFFIDFELLKDDGLLKETDYNYLLSNSKTHRVDYNKQFSHKFQILKIACDNFIKYHPIEFNDFIESNKFFVDKYALFLSIKHYFNDASFNLWPQEFKLSNKQTIEKFEKENSDEINFYKTLQCLFYKQWFSLKQYANSKGIQIIGDTPIYSSYDSSDVWGEAKNFYLDENLLPIDVSGCPPDNFSTKGQLWGTPVYNFNYIKNHNYEFFINKFSHLLKIYDVLRIDHFRGFDSYYAIPYGSIDATKGSWIKAPGFELFKKLKEILPGAKIIAEDLGFITPSVRNLLKQTGFPGMKILEFAFNYEMSKKEESEYLPHKYDENCIAYLGTHDNDTFMGWINSLCDADKKYAMQYLNLKCPDNYYKKALKVLYESKANVVIVQFQDLLGLDTFARMNTPSTVGDLNWSYMLLENELDENIKDFLKNLTIESKRV